MSHNNFKGNAPKNNYLSTAIWCGVVVFLFSAIMAFMTTWFVLAMGGCAEVTEEAVEEPVEEVVSEEIATPEEEPIVSAVCDAEEVEVIPMEYIAEFRITAYCSCKKCCGKWADNRPNGIVYGASGQELKAGVSVASFLPFGTELYIDGLGEYVVQDRPAEWVFDKYGRNVVDVYFDNHEEACQFGLKYLDVYEIRGTNE
jgi:3D (Asp-Asp-Asp) domain-containing protein